MQDRQAEAILQALIELSPKAMQMPPDYEGRANFMWAATNALNNLIHMGVPQDWSTHAIGHELTAFYGLSHAESLAVVLPYLLWYKREQKAEKLIQYGKRVWDVRANGDRERIFKTIETTAAFFNNLGMPTALSAYGVDPDEAAERVCARFTERNTVLGEHEDITPEDVANILRMSR
ncbi:MAG: iron-containing alcohol dehydrogenase [Anaerolineaceae bacterium]|nr:iron-containing alcohol dehydrogenase [Anaerolineaceae bacterium]